jgi:RNA polymerase sigma-70 factor (ECF subfamily)
MEKELLLKAFEGDTEAFEVLVKTYQARLRMYSARYIENSDDVFEVVQEAFINAYRNIDKFDLKREFYPWLRAICLNCIRNYFREKRSCRELPVSIVDEAIESRISDIDEEEELKKQESLNALQKCLNKLNPKHRNILTLRYLKKTAIGKIAKHLSQSPGSISTLLFRIKEILRDCIAKRLEEV